MTKTQDRDCNSKSRFPAGLPALFNTGAITKGVVMYCECGCGCGKITNIIKKNCTSKGLIKGEHRRFIRGHQRIGKSGDESPTWRGGKYTDKRGYVFVADRKHPYANHQGYVLEHRWVSGKIMGKNISPKHPVHHVDGNPSNNKNNNLVICEDTAYHTLLHRREKALKEGGAASWIKCGYCLQYDAPENMYVHPGKENGRHVKCQSEYAKRKRELKKHAS